MSIVPVSMSSTSQTSSPTQQRSSSDSAQAERLIARNTANDRTDIAALGRDLAVASATSPDGAKALRAAVERRLTPVERGQLASNYMSTTAASQSTSRLQMPINDNAVDQTTPEISRLPTTGSAPVRVPSTPPGGGRGPTPPIKPGNTNFSILNQNSSAESIAKVIKSVNRYDGDVAKTTEVALKFFPPTTNPNFGVVVQQAVINEIYGDTSKQPAAIQRIQDGMKNIFQTDPETVIARQISEGQLPRERSSACDCQIVQNKNTPIVSPGVGGQIKVVSETAVAATSTDPNIQPVVTRSQHTTSLKGGPVQNSVRVNTPQGVAEIATEGSAKTNTTQISNIRRGAFAATNTIADVTPKPLIPTYMKPSYPVQFGSDVSFVPIKMSDVTDQRSSTTYTETTINARDGAGGGSYCVFLGPNGYTYLPAGTTNTQPYHKSSITVQQSGSGRNVVTDLQGRWVQPRPAQ